MRQRFEDVEAELDAQVENHLGDSISYSRNGEAPVIIRGFVLSNSDDDNVGGTDPQKLRWRVQINKSRLPEPPTTRDRITHRRMPGIWKPTNGTIIADGRDWFFDLQRAN